MAVCYAICSLVPLPSTRRIEHQTGDSTADHSIGYVQSHYTSDTYMASLVSWRVMVTDPEPQLRPASCVASIGLFVAQSWMVLVEAFLCFDIWSANWWCCWNFKFIGRWWCGNQLSSMLSSHSTRSIPHGAKSRMYDGHSPVQWDHCMQQLCTSSTTYLQESWQCG